MKVSTAMLLVTYALHFVCAVAFLVLSMFTVTMVQRYVNDTYLYIFIQPRNRPAERQSSDPAKSSMSASCILGFIVLLVFLVVSSGALIWTRVMQRKLSALWYGVLGGMGVQNSIVMLLVGLTLNANIFIANIFHTNPGSGYKPVWSNSQYNTYVATFAFAYVTAATHVLLFAAMVYDRLASGKRPKLDTGYGVSFKTDRHSGGVNELAPAGSGMYGAATAWPQQV